MTQHDLVDVAGADSRVRERLGGDAHDQALEGLAFEPPERGMGPANDASGHGGLLSFDQDRPPRSVCFDRNGRADLILTCRILDVFFDHEQRGTGAGGGKWGSSLLPSIYIRPRQALRP